MFIYIIWEGLKIKTEEVIKISKALSEKNRVEIIKLLSDEEICACKLLEHFDIKQPTLSHHMKILSETGLVNVSKKSTWSYYTLNKEKLKEFKDFLDDCMNEKYSLTTANCGCKKESEK